MLRRPARVCAALTLAAFFCASTAFSQGTLKRRVTTAPSATQGATTDEGRRVILRSDGTWAYAANDPDSDDLQKLISLGITLLESKQYEKFLRRFRDPDTLKQVDRAGTFSVMLRKFADKDAHQVLNIFKKIKGTQPDISDYGGVSGRVAKFSYKPEPWMTRDGLISDYGRGFIRFSKKKGVWHFYVE